MSLSKNTKNTRSVRFSRGKSTVIFVSVLIILIVPFVTHAGIFAFISDLFGGQRVSAESQVYIESKTDTNSESMSLLTSPISVDPSLKPSSQLAVVGDEALLPEVGPSTSAPDAIDNLNGQISVYTVRSGDTLSGIASMFDVSANTILWANDLTRSSTLKVGQTLVILPMSGVIHTVVKGDTLQTIAKKYTGDIDEIALFNDIKVTATLSVGDKIMIPDGEMSYSTRPSTVAGAASNPTEKLIVSAGGPSYDGYYQKPFLTGTKTQGLHGYNAVDYGMPVGSPIYAAASGVVLISKSSGYNGGYGDYIVIKHPNNTQTVYGHLSQPVVFAGQNVTQGQLIGYSGNTGKSTGAHLHFEVRGAKNPF